MFKVRYVLWCSSTYDYISGTSLSRAQDAMPEDWPLFSSNDSNDSKYNSKNGKNM